MSIEKHANVKLNKKLGGMIVVRMFKKLPVQGMSCQHCKHNIETSVKQLDGVKEVTAYYNEGYVNVDFDDSQVKLEQIIQEIEDLGFEIK